MSNLPTVPTLRPVDLVSHRHAVSWQDLPSSSQVRFTYSGRAGIYQYLLALAHANSEAGRNVVLVPAFQCPTVVDPVLHAGFKVRFYAVTEQLQVDQADFLRKLDRSVAATLFIRYFGIGDVPRELISASHDAGAKVINDCSHSFLNNTQLDLAGTQGDAAIYSFWKLLPSATAGGGVWCIDEDVKRCWPEQRAAPIMQRARLARQMLIQVKDNLVQSCSGGSPVTVDAMESAPQPVARKSYNDAYPYDRKLSQAGMPGLALHVLRCADLRCIAELRRHHYKSFVDHFAIHSQSQVVFSRLAEGDVPWGIPLILQRRYDRDYLLRARGVPIFSFGEVLHPLLFETGKAESSMISVARYLSENLLGIALHQQLQAEMMSSYAQITNRFLGGLV